MMGGGRRAMGDTHDVATTLKDGVGGREARETATDDDDLVARH